MGIDCRLDFGRGSERVRGGLRAGLPGWLVGPSSGHSVGRQVLSLRKMFPMSRVATDKLHKPWDAPREVSKHQDSCRRQCALASCRHLAGGNQADIFLAEELTERLPEDSTLIGDKAYDSSTLRQRGATKGINTCIPGRRNRTMTAPSSATVYRHRAENFFARIKRYRRVATRYDKFAETFLGLVGGRKLRGSSSWSAKPNGLATGPTSGHC